MVDARRWTLMWFLDLQWDDHLCLLALVSRLDRRYLPIEASIVDIKRFYHCPVPPSSFTVRLLPIISRRGLMIFAELRNGYGRHVYIYNQSEQIEKTAAFLRGYWSFQLLFNLALETSKFAM